MAKKEKAPEEVQQTHPLYETDRDRLDSCLGHDGDPLPQHLTTVGALFSRYGDFPGAPDIRDDLHKLLQIWGLTRDELNVKTREIWGSGWRPGRDAVQDVGSGADVDGDEAKS